MRCGKAYATSKCVICSFVSIQPKQIKGFFPPSLSALSIIGTFACLLPFVLSLSLFLVHSALRPNEDVSCLLVVPPLLLLQ